MLSLRHCKEVDDGGMFLAFVLLTARRESLGKPDTAAAWPDGEIIVPLTTQAPLLVALVTGNS